MTRQEQVCQLMVDHLVKDGHPLSLTVAGISLDTVVDEIFQGYRRSSGSGWQLTDKGFMMMSAVFRALPVKIQTPIPMNARMLVLLDSNCRFPYFLNKKSNDLLESLYLFDQDMAFLLDMHGGDIIAALGQ